MMVAKRSSRIAGRASQRGMSFIGVVLLGVFLVAVVGVGTQVFPTVVEYREALRAIERAKMQTTVGAARADFDRAATIDDIRSISGKDLDIQKNGDDLIISFAYTREIPLFGPAYLLLKYEGHTKQSQPSAKPRI
jgi:uncharacterized protein DUF4845